MFKSYRKIHFIGIGGSGMSGIAEVLLNLGYEVTGSDLKSSEVTERLERMGAKISYGHEAKNLGDAHVAVISTAIRPDNPEVRAARKAKMPVVQRIEMLSELARLKYTVAVAGTHGKTTTTSMVTAVLQHAGLDPTFVVGGRIKHLESGARLGTGDFLVAEADESDGSFLKLSPTVAVVTNIDSDHLDYYGSLKKLEEAFVSFANRVPFYGFTVLCADDPGASKILPRLTRRVITYGTGAGCDYEARDIASGPEGTIFALFHQGMSQGAVRLALTGRHNVLNALAAAACALELGVSSQTLAYALGNFESVGRRLEKRGEKGGAVWVDDYGHHPTEIRATLSALRERYPKGKILVAFQPHRYTRTKLLLKDFGKSFSGADEVVILPIYAAGEKRIPGVDSKALVPLVKKTGVNASFLNGAGESIAGKLKPGTVFLTLGAGDVWKVGERLFK